MREQPRGQHGKRRRTKKQLPHLRRGVAYFVKRITPQKKTLVKFNSKYFFSRILTQKNARKKIPDVTASDFVFLFLAPEPSVVQNLLAQFVCVPVAQKPQVRGERLRLGISPEVFQYPALSGSTQHAVTRKVDPAQEVQARGQSAEIDLVGVEVKIQTLGEERFKLGNKAFEPLPVRRKKEEVIGVTQIMLDFERVFHELIELVEVDVGK